MMKAVQRNIKHDNTYIKSTFAEVQWKFTFYLAQQATRFVSYVHICSLQPVHSDMQGVRI